MQQSILQHGHSSLWPFLLGFFVSLMISTASFLTYRWSKLRHKHLRTAAHVAGLSREDIVRLFRNEDSGGLPVWMEHLDAEHSTWLNDALAILWPNIDRAATAWAFKDRNLENLLNATTFWKPSWLARSGVVLQSLDMGQEPPRVTGLKVYSSKLNTGVKKSSALIADVHFDWVSKLHTVLTMKTIQSETKMSIVDRVMAAVYSTVTVKVIMRDLVARGQLRIEISPLLDEIPVIGAVRVSFLGAPKISYHVSSLGANPMLIPGLESWLNSFILNQVMDPFTFPAGFTLNIAELFGLHNEIIPIRPQGVLSVIVHRASNVPRMDWIGGPVDPYVRLYVAKKKRVAKTSVKAATKEPVWEEPFEFVIHDVSHQELTLELWDSDALSPDDIIGRVTVPLSIVEGMAHGQSQYMTLKVPRVGTKHKEKLPRYEEDGDDGGVGHTGSVQVDDFTETKESLTRRIAGKPTRILKKMNILKSSLDTTLDISLQFFKFSSNESDAAHAASARPDILTTRLTGLGISPRMRRILRGGMLHVDLQRAEGLSRHAGATRTFKLRVKVGRNGNRPLYKKEAQRTGIGRGLDSRNPIFDEKLELLIDGDTAHEPDVVVSVEIWCDHFVFKPSFKGSVTIPLNKIIQSGKMRQSWPLEGGTGTLNMAFEWQGMLEI